MGNNSQKPAIRFQGYTDVWEQRKLSDMCSLITKQTGFDYSESIKPSLVTEAREDTYPFIQNKDFDGENINLNTDFYIPVSVAERFPKITLDTPSLLISISGKIGNVGYYRLNSKAFIGGAVGICKLLEDNGRLLVYALQSDVGQQYFHSLIKASSHANITVEDIRDITIYLPKSKEEYRLLEAFLHNIDEVITLHQRKYEKLVTVKKSMLEKMFPRDGSNTPEIRFTGFTGPWEQRKLGDISDIKTGPFGSTLHADDYVKDGVPIITTEHFKTGLLQQEKTGLPQVSDDDYNRLSSYVLRSGDIVFSRVGSVDINAMITPFQEGWLFSGRVLRVRPREDYSSSFLHAVLDTETVKNDIRSRAVGQTMPSINTEILKATELMVSSFLNEQKQIGKFLTNLDNLITLHQRKLEKLKNIKKSMLEKMFV